MSTLTDQQRIEPLYAPLTPFGESLVRDKYQSQSITKLSAALSIAQGQINVALKDATNPFFKSSYADLASCVKAAKQPLADNGLSVSQVTDFDKDGCWLITQLNHSSGEWIRGRFPLKPAKNDSQAMGSAITYARRYTFCAITGVVPDDDDDGNAASGAQAGSAKGMFKNAALRKTWCENVISSIDAAENKDSLNEIININKDQLSKMKDSGNSHDEMGAEEIQKRYKAKLAGMKTKTFLDRQEEEFKPKD